MMTRTQVLFDAELLQRARLKAADLGISLGEYLRRLVSNDLAQPDRVADVSTVFGLGRSEGSNIARDKDRMIGEATDAAHPRRGRRRGGP